VGIKIYRCGKEKGKIPKLPGVIRFVLDIHLGKLATSLRLLGFDTVYFQ
jgi:hypothetical protein